MNLNLDCGKFSDNIVAKIIGYRAEWHGEGGWYRFRFDNGYGAIVRKRPGTLGYEKDLWVADVLTYPTSDNRDYRVAKRYAPFTRTELSQLTDEGVRNILEEIKELPCIEE